MARSGQSGPIYLYAKGSENLTLSYFAAVRCEIWRPPRMRKECWCEYLYGLANMVDGKLQPGAPQFSARRTLNYALKVQKMPPLAIPPLALPKPLLANLGGIKKAVAKIIAKHPSPIAQKWLQSHITYMAARQTRWTDEFNAKRVIRDYNTSELVSGDPCILAAATRAPSLRAVVAPWRLPQWPTERKVRLRSRQVLRDWCKAVRFDRRDCRYANVVIERLLERIAIPVPPELWAQSEKVMHHAVASQDIIAQDDRNSGKAWCMQGRDAVAAMLAQLHRDVGWHQRPDLRPRQVVTWLRARAVLGLPPFLRTAQ